MIVSELVADLKPRMEQFAEKNGVSVVCQDLDLATIVKEYEPRYTPDGAIRQFEKDCKEAGLIATRVGYNERPRYTVTLRL